MDDKKTTGYILLTYKNKVLLMYKSNSSIDEEKHEWTLLETVKKGNESIKKALARLVFQEAGIKLVNIDFIEDNFYHSRLTDNHVNNIKRDELQLLNFFSKNELNNLNLSNITKDFLAKHNNLI